MKKLSARNGKNFVANIPFFISGSALTALYVTSSLSRLLIALGIAIVLLIASFYLKGIYSFWRLNNSKLSVALTIGMLLVSAYSFYRTMIYSSKLQAIAERLGITVNFLVIILALLGCIAGFYFLNTSTSYVLLHLVDLDREVISDTTPCVTTHIKKHDLLIVIITAIVTITICSKSSPLYPFNDWVDSNCFMTVGKSMLHGKVPYRDLFEQKGPLLYMLHALAALISETSFWGVYILEVIACIAFLFFGLKTMRLYRNSISVYLIPVLSAIVYSTSGFSHGDSAEEFCLPLLAFAIYIGLKRIQNKQSPSTLECLAIGITSSCVLWIKYSMLGFYIGWICVPAVLLLRNRTWKKFFQMLAVIALGVLLPSLPILAYFAMNHAMTDLWTVYFYDNLFLYTTSTESSFISSLIRNLLGGVTNILNFNFLPAVIAGIGGLTLAKRKTKLDFWFVLSSAFGTFLLVYIGGRRYLYYSLIFSAFTSIGLMIVVESVKNYCKNRARPVLTHDIYKYRNVVVCVASVLFAFGVCGNTYMLQYSKSDLPQYKFAEIISQVEGATLLNYGFLDGGFYTTAGIVPNCKYFCNLNIGLPEIMETQEEYVSQGKIDFVITRDAELDSDLYECVAEATFYFEGTEREYLLYQLIQ